MTAPIVVHGFDTSNNMKVRAALGFKGLQYEFREIDPRDRRELVRISGQHLTPVLEHGKTVLFDSAAILRYLDANFPETPKLFGSSHRQQWEIEDWELFARAELAGPMMEVVHLKVYGDPVDEATMTRCTGAFHAAVDKLRRRMDGRRWLVGETMTAADVTAAAVIHRIRVAGLFSMPEISKSLDDWVRGVMCFDERSGVV